MDGPLRSLKLFGRVAFGLILVAAVGLGILGVMMGELLYMPTALVLLAGALAAARPASDLNVRRSVVVVPAARRLGWIMAAVLGALFAISFAGLLAGSDDSFHATQRAFALLALIYGGIAYSALHFRTRDPDMLVAARVPLVLSLCAYIGIGSFAVATDGGLVSQLGTWGPAVAMLWVLVNGGRLPWSRAQWCPECVRENEPDALHCDGCGTALGVRCAGCAQVNHADARHCKRCGAELVQPSSSLAATRPST